jgi:large subunit ribosomal protein L18
MNTNRTKRHLRIRKKISGSLEKPRVAVYRSNKYIQVHLIDDESHKVICGMTTKTLELKKATKTDEAKELGVKFAALVLKNGTPNVVFDRGGYKYHGRVKALADSLRESGLKF